MGRCLASRDCDSAFQRDRRKLTVAQGLACCLEPRKRTATPVARSAPSRGQTKRPDHKRMHPRRPLLNRDSVLQHSRYFFVYNGVANIWHWVCTVYPGRAEPWSDCSDGSRLACRIRKHQSETCKWWGGPCGY